MNKVISNFINKMNTVQLVYSTCLVYSFAAGGKEDDVNIRKSLLHPLPPVLAILSNSIVLQLSPSQPLLLRGGLGNIVPSHQPIRAAGPRWRKIERCGNSCLEQTAEETDRSPRKCFIPSTHRGPNPRPVTDWRFVASFHFSEWEYSGFIDFVLVHLAVYYTGLFSPSSS